MRISREPLTKYIVLPLQMDLCKTQPESTPIQPRTEPALAQQPIPLAAPGSSPLKAKFQQQSGPSAMITSSSQRDTQTRLHSSGNLRASYDKDDYLLRLLGKGAKPPRPPASAGFRIPDPVPQRAAQASNRPGPLSGADPLVNAALKASQPAGNNTATASGQPNNSEILPGWSYAETQQRMGAESASALRTTVVHHQVAF